MTSNAVEEEDEKLQAFRSRVNVMIARACILNKLECAIAEGVYKGVKGQVHQAS